MRVTGGSARGVPLIAPRGPETRPTSDRVREAIFSILFSMDASFDRVLDLYAGTGALAIEALSRGDGTADIVEQAPAACAIIRRNLGRTKFTDRARVQCRDVHLVLPRLSGSYTAVFLDPPYRDTAAATILSHLGAAGLIAEGGVVIYEHAARNSAPDTVGGLALHSDRRYGDTGVAFYR